MTDTGSTEANALAAAEEFAALLTRSTADARILGVILSGSQAREGTATTYSDYDVLLVVEDAAETQFTAEHRRDSRLDVSTIPLTEFRTHALPGSGVEWNRYGFTHAKILKDTPDGLIAELAAAKAQLSPAEAAQLAPAILDGFLNSAYRCLKNNRDGNTVAARLDGAEAISPYLTYVFALHDRVRPYNKYLAWELERFPLSHPQWDAETLLPLLVQAHTGDTVEAIHTLFNGLEPHARAAGHASVLDDWGNDLLLLRGLPATP
ncbi:aminoglycoside 6-adenylyltransferase [Kribbella deserti]|uniref:Aminoglycoside 6-adenylyltransferase n=1 Tax=Kribbella deserti TaxID=1926257 RepID=A0ABV6QWU8_9ACTN